MKKLILLILLTVTLSASDRIFIMTESFHISSKDYNNHNYGIGYEHTLYNGLGVQIGTYRNSYDNQTVLAGAHYRYNLTDNLTLNASISYVTKYDNIKFIPLVGVQYKYVRVVANRYVTNLQLIFEF